MVPDAEMKTPRLAYVLNEGNSPGEWTFKVGENNNLPKFRADTDGDIFRVEFKFCGTPWITALIRKKKICRMQV